jgi:hypothetical protein
MTMDSRNEACVATIEPLPLGMRAKIKARMAPRPDALTVEVPIDVRLAKRPKVRVVSTKTGDDFPFKLKRSPGMLLVIVDPMEVRDPLRVWVRVK